MNRLEVKGEMWGRTAYAICGEWNRTKSMALTGCFAAKILGSSAGSAHSGEWGGGSTLFYDRDSDAIEKREFTEIVGSARLIIENFLTQSSK